jgi:hypothetical protein
MRDGLTPDHFGEKSAFAVDRQMADQSFSQDIWQVNLGML